METEPEGTENEPEGTKGEDRRRPESMTGTNREEEPDDLSGLSFYPRNLGSFLRSLLPLLTLRPLRSCFPRRYASRFAFPPGGMGVSNERPYGGKAGKRMRLEEKHPRP